MIQGLGLYLVVLCFCTSESSASCGPVRDNEWKRYTHFSCSGTNMAALHFHIPLVIWPPLENYRAGRCSLCGTTPGTLSSLWKRCVWILGNNSHSVHSLEGSPNCPIYFLWPFLSHTLSPGCVPATLAFSSSHLKLILALGLLCFSSFCLEGFIPRPFLGHSL